MNIFKVLLSWGKIAAGLAAAIPLLEELAANDYESAARVILQWGDVQDLGHEVLALIPENLKPVVEPALRAYAAKVAVRFAEKLDKLVPEEILLGLLPH